MSDYLDMLLLQEKGEPFVKANHRLQLMSKLDGYYLLPNRIDGHRGDE